MPWTLLRYNDRKLKQSLSEEYEVNKLPSLVLFDEEGELLTVDGTGLILTVPFEDIKSFHAGSMESNVNMSERMALLPESVQHESHEHLLYKVYDVYGEGSYGCDICAGGGEMWAYHCEECGFDVHPHCVIADWMSYKPVVQEADLGAECPSAPPSSSSLPHARDEMPSKQPDNAVVTESEELLDL